MLRRLGARHAKLQYSAGFQRRALLGREVVLEGGRRRQIRARLVGGEGPFEATDPQHHLGARCRVGDMSADARKLQAFDDNPHEGHCTYVSLRPQRPAVVPNTGRPRNTDGHGAMRDFPRGCKMFRAFSDQFGSYPAAAT